MLAVTIVCATALHAALHVVPAVRAPRVHHARMCANPDDKRLRAEQLALLAEQAALEAEQLELEAQKLKANSPTSPPAEVAPAPRSAGDLLRAAVKTPAPAVEDASPAVPAPTSSDDDEEAMALRAPLRWLGPYPGVALSLPDATSPAQKARLLTNPADVSALGGVTLDFVLDTAANTNTISGQVAGPTGQGGLELDQVGSVPAGVGAGGALGGGATYMIGRIQLADVPATERVTFMSGLSASALPVAAPGAAGLLGVAFLDSFQGGVEFVWGPAPTTNPVGPAVPAPITASPAAVPPPAALSAGSSRPSIAFYGDTVGTDALRTDLCPVPIKRLNSGLPSVTLSVNGVNVRALLDTGAPVTVLNAAAAKAAGVEYDAALGDAGTPQSTNPFVMFGAAMKAGQAASKGDVLVVAGAAGPVRLVRTSQPATLSLDAAAPAEGGEAEASFGECPVYVGDLPGLAALDGLGASAGPAVVLGTDVLRRRPRMWYTPSCVYL